MYFIFDELIIGTKLFGIGFFIELSFDEDMSQLFNTSNKAILLDNKNSILSSLLSLF